MRQETFIGNPMYIVLNQKHIKSGCLTLSDANIDHISYSAANTFFCFIGVFSLCNIRISTKEEGRRIL